MFKKIKELAREVQVTKACFHGYIANVEESLENRWELFRAAPHWLKDIVPGPWVPDLKGLYVLDWRNDCQCRPFETCDPSELLVEAMEAVDELNRCGQTNLPNTFLGKLQSSPILYNLFREAILRDNVGTFECPGTRS